MPKKKKAIEGNEINSVQAAFNSLGLSSAEISAVDPNEVLRSPSTGLNLALGKDKGFRKGSIVQWYGPEGVFKTWVALEMCREAQKKWPDKAVAYVDVEYRVDVVTAATDVGVNFEHLPNTTVPACLYLRPDNAEEAWDNVLQMARSGAFSLIVVDSIKSMVSKAQLENDDPDKVLGQVGAAARLNSAILPMVAQACVKSGTIVWLINQERIVSVHPVPKVSYPGGGALGFYPTHIISVEYMPRPADAEETKLIILTEKNKYGTPRQKLEVPVIFGHGIDAEGDLVEVAVGRGLLTKNGSWYYAGDQRIGQGRRQAGDYLRANPGLLQSVTAAIYNDGTPDSDPGNANMESAAAS